MKVEQLKELRRKLRVADQLVSGHSVLRDRLRRRSMVIEILILVASGVLAALVFVDPVLAASLVPYEWSPKGAIGVLALFTFLASIVLLRVDWSGRSALHGRAAESWATAKAAIGSVLEAGEDIRADLINAAEAKYEAAGLHSISIPEDEFLALKRRHLIKVEISKQLDRRPGTNLFFATVRLWWSDNIVRRDD